MLIQEQQKKYRRTITIFLIIEETKKAVLDFLQGNVKMNILL